jgi:hypothetical protein
MPWVMLTPRGGGPIDAVRNDLVDQALAAECTHVWFCDTDQIYPQDTLVRLMSHDLPVVAAKVHRRYPPYDPILKRGEIDNFVTVPDSEWKRGGLVEVDATGMGSVLIKAEVFENTDRPWFRWLLYDRPEPVGEDIYFWDLVKKAGYKIHVDCSIHVGHLATLSITPESYWAYKFSNQFGDKEKK